VVILEEKRIIRWAIDNKEDWGREEEIEEDHRKIKDITNGHLLFVMGALILQRAQKCEVRQVTKDVVKSEV